MDSSIPNIINRMTAAIRTLNTRLDIIESMVSEIRNNVNNVMDELNAINETPMAEEEVSPFSMSYLGDFTGNFNGNINGTFNGNANINKLNASYYSTELTGNIMIPSNISVFEIKGLGDENTIISFPIMVNKGEIILIKNNTSQNINIKTDENMNEVLNAGNWNIYIYNGVNWS
jgi:hypothetical protein